MEKRVLFNYGYNFLYCAEPNFTNISFYDIFSFMFNPYVHEHKNTSTELVPVITHSKELDTSEWEVVDGEIVPGTTEAIAHLGNTSLKGHSPSPQPRCGTNDWEWDREKF